MDRDFSHITGELRQGELASIRFYGKITEESATRFNSEFDYIESIRPSLIRVLINCEGGSVLHGMSSYATIQNSIVPTECINEGMAASMGSVLWAAGDRSLMRDYAILMIHNPFLPDAEGEAGDMVTAFTKQIKTIYRKRFGLSEKHIESIMTGDAGKDGTFFDAESAVRAGIIPACNILSTTPQLRDKVREELSALENMADIRTMMGHISAEAQSLNLRCELEQSHLVNHVESEEEKARESGIKPFVTVLPTLNQTKENEMSVETKTSAEYSAVAATLGMSGESQPGEVVARISELISTEAKFKDNQKALSDAQTVIAGSDATIKNLQKELGEATASLSTYQKKEKDERKAHIESLLEGAITAGKIDRSSKADWAAMAEANLTLAETTLGSIPAREQISKEIAGDPASVKAATEAAKSAEEKMAERVATVVGEKFEFRKID